MKIILKNPSNVSQDVRKWLSQCVRKFRIFCSASMGLGLSSVHAAILGNAVVIANPSADMVNCTGSGVTETCQSQFINSLTSDERAKLSSVYLDTASIDYDGVSPSGDDLQDACGGHPNVVNAFAAAYSNLATGASALCQNLGTVIRTYASEGLKVYVWVSSSDPFPLLDGSGQWVSGVDLASLEEGFKTLLQNYAPNNTFGNPTLSGLIFENTGLFGNVTRSGLEPNPGTLPLAVQFYNEVISSAAPGQTIMIYEPPTPEYPTDQITGNFVRLIPLYDLSTSQSKTSWGGGAFASFFSDYSPELPSDYSSSVASQLAGHGTQYGNSVPYQYILPASGQNSIWGILQGYGTVGSAVAASGLKSSQEAPLDVNQPNINTQYYQYQKYPDNTQTQAPDCATGLANLSCTAYVATISSASSGAHPSSLAPLADDVQARHVSLSAITTTKPTENRDLKASSLKPSSVSGVKTTLSSIESQAVEVQKQYIQMALNLIQPAVANTNFQGIVLYNVRPTGFWQGLAAKRPEGCNATTAVAQCVGTLPNSIDPSIVGMLF